MQLDGSLPHSEEMGEHSKAHQIEMRLMRHFAHLVLTLLFEPLRGQLSEPQIGILGLG
jgi:hypothetical protein